MDKKCLVAYFSASGRTEKVALALAEATGADLYGIAAQIPYTQADLDWNDKNSRCVKEWKDKSSRPEICKPMPDISQYDVIFLGYPIWWEESPEIIYTFLESYDFSGKTVVPFSTSGGSVRGSKGTHLHKFCSKQTKWEDGKLFRNVPLEKEITEWRKRL